MKRTQSFQVEILILTLCIIIVKSGQIALLDCDGNLFAFPKENQEHAVAVNLGNYADMLSLASDRYSKRFGCICPKAKPEDILKMNSLFSAWLPDMYANWFAEDQMTYVPGCEEYPFSALGTPFFKLPSTCDWGRDKQCLAYYEIAESVTFQVAVAECPNSHLPFVSVNCNGTGCDSLGMPCVSDKECGGSLTCNPFLGGEKDEPIPGNNDISESFLSSIGLASQVFGCSNPMRTATTLGNFIRKYMYDTSAESLGDDHIQYCSPGVFKSSKMIQTLNESTRIFDCAHSHFKNKTRGILDCVSNAGPLSAWNGYNNEGINVLSWKHNGPYKVQPNVPHPRTPGAVVVLDLDCDDNIQILPGSKFGTQVHVRNLRRNFDLVYDAYRSKLDCESKSLGFSLDDAIMAANYFLPEFWSLFTLNDQEKQKFRLPVQTFAGEVLRNNQVSLLDLPSTCNHDSWDSKGSCEVSYNGLSSLLGMDLTFNVAIKKCGFRQFPNIYVECVGSDCNILSGLVACDPSQPSTCPNGECQSAKDLLLEVNRMTSYAPPVDIFNVVLQIESPSCPFTNTTEITNDYQALLQTFGLGRDAHVCYPSFERIQQTASGWIRTQAYQVGDNMVKFPDIKPWVSPQ